MRGIESAREERQLSSGEDTGQSLTQTPYHTSGGTAREFRLKRLADTADRSNFPRLDLPAARKGFASTNPRGEYRSDPCAATALLSREVA